MTEAARQRWQDKLDYLLEQEAIVASPAQRFELQQQITECHAKLAELEQEGKRRREGAGPPLRVDLTRLPHGAQHFFGRQPELAALAAAWADGSRTAIVELIAPGGTGKTALVKRALDQLRGSGWGRARAVYGWSFFSQGSGDDRQASEDLFLATALDWLGVAIDPAANPADKGRALAECLQDRRTLLVLDGLEPLQYPPGPLAGELRAPGLKTLLTALAAAGQPGVCIVTSRQRLTDLDEWQRGPDPAPHPEQPAPTRVQAPADPAGPVLRIDLQALSDEDGARLLHRLGANRAGAAAIGPEDPELITANREVQGHALTLSLLGRFLHLAHGGDIRSRDRVDLTDADQAHGGRAARVIAAYEGWFGTGGDEGARALAALRLLAFFDRPAGAELLQALRAVPPIPGLTEALFTSRNAGDGRLPVADETPSEPVLETTWRVTLTRLADAGLIAPLDGPLDDRASLDAHPLVREYLAAALAERCPDAWREGHRRLYEWLKESAPYRPDGLDGLQPLYQAIAHGCQAGLWQEVLVDVYVDRILRGTWPNGDYCTRQLGAFGADLGAVACFFTERDWTRPATALSEHNRAWLSSQALSEHNRAWLLNQAAFDLRALGRLGEAIEPMRVSGEMDEKRGQWTGAAISYQNLSELKLTLGRVAESVADAERSVGYAVRSGEAVRRMIMRTTLADALHQRGETEQARLHFAEAEKMQAELEPRYPIFYSLRSFQYCDLLLAEAERAAWRAELGVAGRAGDESADVLANCKAIARRAEEVFRWRKLPIWKAECDSPLSIALDHLTLARCALYADRLQGRSPGREAQARAEQSLDGLRAAGRQDFLPGGLLTRAWLRHAQHDPAGARAELAEADRIARRGGMALHLADIALHRARLFHDRAALAQARQLIESCGYGRRLPELEDADSAAADWPA